MIFSFLLIPKLLLIRHRKLMYTESHCLYTPLYTYCVFCTYLCIPTAYSVRTSVYLLRTLYVPLYTYWVLCIYESFPVDSLPWYISEVWLSSQSQFRLRQAMVWLMSSAFSSTCSSQGPLPGGRSLRHDHGPHRLQENEAIRFCKPWWYGQNMEWH